MVSTPLHHCNCCGLARAEPPQDDCPRCGYPLTVSKEKHYLAVSLPSLQREAAYNSPDMSVAQLIQRYRLRLDALDRLDSPQPAPVVNITPPLPRKSEPTVHPNELAQPVYPTPPPVILSLGSVASGQERQRPVRSFSFSSFLEEQAINVVASLGAFLILVGALSFVATTTNLLLSFLTVFVVHAIFGITGVASYRYRSFRMVATIYTAIFALLVPLVGFSAYRVVSGNMLQLSIPVVIAIAAIYAALAYGTLAVYQKFQPFGYLAIVALIVAVLALAVACKLGYWWWPSIILLLAMCVLLAVPPRSPLAGPFGGLWEVLHEPFLKSMCVCVLLCMLSFVSIFAYSLILRINGGYVLREMESALFTLSFLLLCWSALLVVHAKHVVWAKALPYLFLLSGLMFLAMLEVRLIVYVLLLTAIALLYHGLTRFAAQVIQTFPNLAYHLEMVALVLVGLLPFLVLPSLPLYLYQRAYEYRLGRLPLTWEISAGLFALLLASALTISSTLSHSDPRKVPAASQMRWRWLLLLSSFLLNSAYGIIVLLLDVEPVWWLLGLALVFVAGAVVVRRFVGAAWAVPLDVLVLLEVAWTLLFSFNHGSGQILLLWFFFAILFYGVMLYQRRARGLFLPLVFAVLMLPVLLTRLDVLFVASVVLPLAAACVRRFSANSEKWSVRQGGARLPIVWEWPLLAVGLLYGILFGLLEIALHPSVSIVQGWLHVPFSGALELAVIALIWYAAALLGRIKWWLLAVVGFAVGALIVPGTSFWVFVWLAPLVMLLALGVSRIAGKAWAAPLYIVAIVAAGTMGVVAYTQGQVSAATWALLIFAVIVYLAGCVEQFLPGLWLASFFAIWSVFYSGQLGDLYRPPLMFLICAILGVGVGCLHLFIPALRTRRTAMLGYTLPLYATSCAAAVLTGVYGALFGVNVPFLAALPLTMLVYGLVAYGVVLFERRLLWQWLAFAFIVWGILLMPQAASCLSTATSACSMQGQSVLFYLTGIALAMGVFGIISGYVVKRAKGVASFSGWPWYLASCIAAATLAVWGSSVIGPLPDTLVVGALGVLVVFTVLLMLLERVPEMVLVPLALAAWTLGLVSWPRWQQMLAYSLLCVLIFATQFIWRVLTPKIYKFSAMRLLRVLGVYGQLIVVLSIIVQGGLVVAAGRLAHVGAGALVVLAALLVWYGLIHSSTAARHACSYSGGLLVMLAISWELSALGLTHIDWLTLAPAVYLVVAAPFVARDELLPRHLVQVCSLVGSGLLLLPILWISFSESNLIPTVILASEALFLLLLGIMMRVRIFVLSGAALVVVGAMHALFLPSLGIPSSLALALLGILLLAIATALSLARRQLQSAWRKWD